MTGRRLLRNFASMAVLRVGLAALTFALFWILSHRLSTAELGGFSLLMNTFFMVQTLPLLGMTMPLMRRIASYPENADIETSNACCFALPVGAAIGIGVALTGRLYAGEHLLEPFILLGTAMLPTSWIVVAESVLVGREEMHYIAYANLLESLGRVAGGWAVIAAGWGLAGVFSVFVALRCVVALGYLLNRRIPRPRWCLVAPALLRRAIREAPTYFSIALVTALCTRLDILLIAKLLSLREAGVYAAAARLSDAALMIPTMAAVVMFPSQSRLFDADRAAFARILEHAVRWCLISGFAVTLIVVALAPLLIHGIYAPTLAGAAPLLQILILGASIMVLDQLLSTSMMAARAQQADLKSMSLGLVTLVALLLGCTQAFGLMGAALAVPGALLVRVLYRLHWGQQEFATPLLIVAMRILLAAVVSLAVYYGHPAAHAAGNLACALAAYAVGLWLTGAVPRTEWRSLRHWMSRSAELGA